jgi:hypothetical protein
MHMMWFWFVVLWCAFMLYRGMAGLNRLYSIMEFARGIELSGL